MKKGIGILLVFLSAVFAISTVLSASSIVGHSLTGLMFTLQDSALLGQFLIQLSVPLLFTVGCGYKGVDLLKNKEQLKAMVQAGGTNANQQAIAHTGLRYWFWIAVLLAGVASLYWFKFDNSHKEMPTPGPVAQQNSDHTYVAPNQINTPSSVTKLESQLPIGSGMPSSNRYNTVGNYPITDCVKDNSTGLTWEGKPVSGERASSKTYTNRRSGDTSAYAKVVNEMHLCGFSDWRLPTNDELVSLVVKGGKPTIDTTWFPNTQPSDYWTSSPWGGDEGRAEAVDFGNGTSGGPYRGDEARVRLVRQ